MLAKNNSSEARTRRVTARIEPPALEDAIAAAQGLTDDIDSQVEIASQLMGLPEDEVRPVVMRAAAPIRQPYRPSAPVRNEGSKVVVVERRRPRLALPR
jgi:hypothetical protein